MHEHTAHKHDISNAIARVPLAIARNHNDGQKHEREAVVDGAQSPHEAQRIAVSDEEGEGVAG